MIHIQNSQKKLLYGTNLAAESSGHTGCVRCFEYTLRLRVQDQTSSKLQVDFVWVLFTEEQPVFGSSHSGSVTLLFISSLICLFNRGCRQASAVPSNLGKYQLL